jgi:biopolymer transport protein ExbD
MKLSRTVKYNPEYFNLIPLLNVLFLVVAFVTLSNTFVIQPGVSVSLPVSSFAFGPQRNPQIVNISAGVTPIIYFHGEKISVEELDKKLSSTAVKERSLVIKADRAVPYEMVSVVANLGLQRGYTVLLAAATQAR